MKHLLLLACLSLPLCAQSWTTTQTVTAEWGAFHVVEDRAANRVMLIVGAHEWTVTGYRVNVSYTDASGHPVKRSIVADRDYQWLGMTAVEVGLPSGRSACRISVQPLRDEGESVSAEMR